MERWKEKWDSIKVALASGMKVIEEHVELKDDFLTIAVPLDWIGKGATLTITLDEEYQDLASEPNELGND